MKRKLQTLKTRKMSQIMLMFLVFISVSSLSASEKSKIINVGQEIQQPKESITITGKVVDEDGNALPAVNVVHKGDNVGTYTDFDGNYSLEVKDMNHFLTFSFIGYEVIDEPIEGRKTIDIVLKPSAHIINDVVVTGYQTIKAERSTGAFAKVNSEEMEEFYSPNVSNILEGKVAGLSSKDGEIVIRGVSTINGNSSPLVVVDGMPLATQTLDDINPNDIETVTVLKDAAATSIYGARAANGVIVVTTKKAKGSGTQVNASANYTYTPKDRGDYLNLLSNANYVDYETEYLNNTLAYQNDPMTYFAQEDALNQWYSPVYKLYSDLAKGNLSQAEVDAKLNELKSRGEYRNQYNDNILQDEFRQQYNMSLLTGTEKSSVSLSLNANTNRGNTIKSSDDRFTIFFKNDIKFYDWLNVSYGVNTVLSSTKNQKPDIKSAQAYEQILDADGNRVQREVINPFWSENMRSDKNTALGLYDMRYNMLDEYDTNGSENKTQKSRLFLNTNIKFIDELSLDMMFQYDYANSETKDVKDEESYYMRSLINKYAEFVPGGTPDLDSYKYNMPRGGRLFQQSDTELGYLLRTQLNFKKTISSIHNVSAIAGFEMSESNLTRQNSTVYGYDDQTLRGQMAVDWSDRQINGSLYPTAVPFVSPSIGRREDLNRYVSMYANLGYTLLDKYTLTGSYRVDQTNLFGTDPKNRFRPLWSAGLAWLISDEGFMEDAKAIDYLKFRTSYGIGGNVDKTTSPFLTARSITSMLGVPTYIFQTPPNPFLRWEKVATFNIGIDYAMFNNRLQGSIDAYSKYSSDLLANKNIDPSLGFAVAKVNNGEMSNKGVELSVDYTWVRSENWTFSTQLTAAYNANEVTKVNYNPNVADDLLGNGGYYLEGSPLSTIYGYEYEGLDANGDPLVHDIIKGADGVERDTIVSGNYVTNYDALVNLGQTDPKWTGAFQPVLRYKNFRLSALLSFYTGNVMRDQVTPLYKKLSGSQIHGDVANRWTPSNTDTNIPRMASQDLQDGYRDANWKYANVNVIDASSVFLRNVVLSYSLNHDLVKKMNMKSLRFNFQVNDPWMWQAELQSNYTRARIIPSYIFGLSLGF